MSVTEDNSKAAPATSKKYPFGELVTDDEKVQWMMAEYKALQEVGPDGIDFSGKTSMWVAYERHLESLQESPLFVDPLAEKFMEPYGKRLSIAMMVAMKAVFDPIDEIGFGFQGHICYTAARTKYINDAIEKWINDSSWQMTKTQVVNLGAGLDRRAFWLKTLRHAEFYIEVDTVPVLTYKGNILESIDPSKVNPMCKRKIVAMDFSKETIACLPFRHDFDTNISTCWALEGLVMYLTKETVDQLLKEMTELSSPGSLAIINFFPRPLRLIQILWTLACSATAGKEKRRHTLGITHSTMEDTQQKSLRIKSLGFAYISWGIRDTENSRGDI